MRILLRRPDPPQSWTWTYSFGASFLLGEWLAGRGPWHLLARAEEDPQLMGEITDGAPDTPEAIIELGPTPTLQIGAAVHPRAGEPGPPASSAIIAGVAWLEETTSLGPTLRVRPGSGLAAPLWESLRTKVPWDRLAGLTIDADPKRPSTPAHLAALVTLSAPNLRWYRGPLTPEVAAWLPVSVTRVGPLVGDWAVVIDEGVVHLEGAADRIEPLAAIGPVRAAAEVRASAPSDRVGPRLSEVVTHLVVPAPAWVAGQAFPRLRELVVGEVTRSWTAPHTPALEVLEIKRLHHRERAAYGVTEADAQAAARAKTAAIEAEIRQTLATARIAPAEIVVELTRADGAIRAAIGPVEPKVVPALIAAIVDPAVVAGTGWPKKPTRASLRTWAAEDRPGTPGVVGRHLRVIERWLKDAGNPGGPGHTAWKELPNALLELAEDLARRDGVWDHDAVSAMLGRLGAK